MAFKLGRSYRASTKIKELAPGTHKQLHATVPLPSVCLWEGLLSINSYSSYNLWGGHVSISTVTHPSVCLWVRHVSVHNYPSFSLSVRGTCISTYLAILQSICEGGMYQYIVTFNLSGGGHVSVHCYSSFSPSVIRTYISTQYPQGHRWRMSTRDKRRGKYVQGSPNHFACSCRVTLLATSSIPAKSNASPERGFPAIILKGRGKAMFHLM